MFVMVTGGSGSGKSAYAEQRIVQFCGSRRFYVATMMCGDDETRERILRHRRMRAGKEFETIERQLDLPGLFLPSGSGQTDVLLECMSNLAANEMFDPAGCKDAAYANICAGIDRLLDQCDNLVVVTNEIFSDGALYDELTMQYMRLLGRINRYMASRADEVVEVVCGIPVMLRKKVRDAAAGETADEW